MYRVGFPGWKFAARIGIPLKMRVDIYRDEESQTYWAKSPDLDGLVTSGETLEELRKETLQAASLLLELQIDGNASHATADFNYREPIACPA